jgi:hypothetical protein
LANGCQERAPNWIDIQQVHQLDLAEKPPDMPNSSQRRVSQIWWSERPGRKAEPYVAINPR